MSVCQRDYYKNIQLISLKFVVVSAPATSRKNRLTFGGHPIPDTYCASLFQFTHLGRIGYFKRFITISHIQSRYDSVYLTCGKKLTGSQLSPPHGTSKKLKCETKNKTMSMTAPVQSRCHEGSPVVRSAAFCKTRRNY